MASTASDNNSETKKKLTEAYLHQIKILRVLSETTASEREMKHFQLNEIAELTGLKDEKETQRFLYILEGQKLVSPHPTGDFTSRHWYITKDGVKALSSISASGIAA